MARVHRLYIPMLGDTIRLASPWSFTIHKERRNVAFIDEYGATPGQKCTIPKGTELRVERIYIRQGAAGFSSMTLRIVGKANSRFWAKLDECNGMQFTQVKARAEVEKDLDRKFEKTYPNGVWVVDTATRMLNPDRPCHWSKLYLPCPRRFSKVTFTKTRPSRDRRGDTWAVWAERGKFVGWPVARLTQSGLKPNANRKVFSSEDAALQFIAQFLSLDDAVEVMQLLRKSSN